MAFSVLLQTFVLLLSGGFNSILSPNTISVDKQLFLSSLILIIGCIEALALLIIKVLLRKLCRVHITYGMAYLIAPLTTAMGSRLTERPGETGDAAGDDDDCCCCCYERDAAAAADSDIDLTDLHHSHRPGDLDLDDVEADLERVERELRRQGRGGGGGTGVKVGPNAVSSMDDGDPVPRAHPLDSRTDPRLEPRLDPRLDVAWDDADSVLSADAENLRERDYRNVFTDIYVLGIASFTVTYCIDATSPLPSASFLFGIVVMTLVQSTNILIILYRGARYRQHATSAGGATLKRTFTLVSSICMLMSYLMFCIGIIHTGPTTFAASLFDAIFSFALPLVCPILLTTISPKSNPLQTIIECSPFVFTLSAAFFLFFLTTRGQLSAIVHQISWKETNLDDTGDFILSIPYIDIEVHSDVNASLHFTTTELTGATHGAASDPLSNLPLLLLAPFIKVPTIIIVISSVINRSGLVVSTSMLLVLAARELANKIHNNVPLSVYHVYVSSLVFTTLALTCNIIKHCCMKRWMRRDEAASATLAAQVAAAPP